MRTGTSLTVWTLVGTCCASSPRSSSTESRPRLSRSTMRAGPRRRIIRPLPLPRRPRTRATRLTSLLMTSKGDIRSRIHGRVILCLCLLFVSCFFSAKPHPPTSVIPPPLNDDRSILNSPFLSIVNVSFSFFSSRCNWKVCAVSKSTKMKWGSGGGRVGHLELVAFASRVHVRSEDPFDVGLGLLYGALSDLVGAHFEAGAHFGEVDLAV